MKKHRLLSPFRGQPRRLMVLAGVIAGLAATVIPVASAQAALSLPLLSVVTNTVSAVTKTVSAVTSALVPTTPALAPSTPSSTGGCSITASLSKPFDPWGDSNYYDLVPGGDFEGSLAGWTLSGGAQTVAGSEPYAASGTLGSYSMYIPAGGSVQSPYFCVDANEPSFRFFVQNDKLLSSLAVDVVYENAKGNQVAVPVGSEMLNSKWEPSSAMPTGGALAAAENANGTAQVALRFVAVNGPSQIDDLFVDPRCK